ncbi:hypothetical protein DPMN_139015 [Dreissena polymorpha]|uniref:Uncharacterized protein n=1 Tax=Dreissena polymorpha TaxID=45954 RepID=A0A9D4JF94_DREPO|nr:hypothetical protein DPMN_139015 [Dreissena polymorpha]
MRSLKSTDGLIRRSGVIEVIEEVQNLWILSAPVIPEYNRPGLHYKYTTQRLN